jgi:hypothetical protein
MKTALYLHNTLKLNWNNQIHKIIEPLAKIFSQITFNMLNYTIKICF